LSKDIEKFVKDFPIFHKFPRELNLAILNNLSKKTIYKGDYLYKKGEESNNIYFLKFGNINLSFNLSFAWFDDYLKYLTTIVEI
jgi:CRP-like cAMP-binding protein